MVPLKPASPNIASYRSALLRRCALHRSRCGQLHTQNRGLQRVEPEVPTDGVVMISHLCAMLPDGRAASSRAAPSRVVTRPASPNAPRFFDGKKEKHPIAPNPPTAISRYFVPIAWAASSMTGMRCLIGNGHHRVYIGTLAEQVHGDNRFGFRGNCSGEARQRRC